MAGRDIMTHIPVILEPDASRTVIRPFSPEDPEGFATPGHPRAQRIADRVLALDEQALRETLRDVLNSLAKRHRAVEAMLLRRYDELDKAIGRGKLSRDQTLLIAAYLSEEYSFESAALFNPSVVLHPDQADLPADTVRFVMALRGIGEGHVSSVTFRTGTWGPGDTVHVDPPSAHGVPPRIERQDGARAGGSEGDAMVKLTCAESREISETVIFPVTPSQRQGIEDLRLVNFVEDDGTALHLGTYTAFSGAAVREEMLHATDFRHFEMYPLSGAAASNKGMALFPRRIGGRYAMLGREDNESIFLLTSDDLHVWEKATKIISPRFEWEFVQMGNCGSPIEIDEGWLVLTHGVGAVRTYCIGACLLDKDDPSKLLARTPQPLISPGDKGRAGYVPNVVYSCGAMRRDRRLLIPYGVADNYATFATTTVDAVLGAMN